MYMEMSYLKCLMYVKFYSTHSCDEQRETRTSIDLQEYDAWKLGRCEKVCIPMHQFTGQVSDTYRYNAARTDCCMQLVSVYIYIYIVDRSILTCITIDFSEGTLSAVVALIYILTIIM